jgi:hypothetical protein
MAFRIKEGVYGELKDVMIPALEAVQRVWSAYGYTPTITSIEDGTHRPGSLHYAGLAFDIRLNDIPNAMHEKLTAAVASVIGSAYDVVHENHGTPNDHLHVEFDPS